MLTIFSTAKPFVEHSGTIQRNALKSWTMLHPKVEVILFGNEAGAAEICAELGIRHEPNVRCNKRGTKFLNYIFDRANEISRHNVLCYANCDIMFGPDFCKAVMLSGSHFSRFLLVGQRWDTKIVELWNFEKPDWPQQLKSVALRSGTKNGVGWIDYFCFSRGLYYKQMPPFLVGRNGWDPWLVWYSLANRIPTIDVSHDVVAVHQNHDYAYLGRGKSAVLSEEEAKYNWSLGHSAEWHNFTTDAASTNLINGEFRRNLFSSLAPARRRMTFVLYPIWFSILNWTRPLRQALGLRKTTETKLDLQ
jgi:hypothetical protein